MRTRAPCSRCYFESCLVHSCTRMRECRGRTTRRACGRNPPSVSESRKPNLSFVNISAKNGKSFRTLSKTSPRKRLYCHSGHFLLQRKLGQKLLAPIWACFEGSVLEKLKTVVTIQKAFRMTFSGRFSEDYSAVQNTNLFYLYREISDIQMVGLNKKCLEVLRFCLQSQSVF